MSAQTKERVTHQRTSARDRLATPSSSPLLLGPLSLSITSRLMCECRRRDGSETDSSHLYFRFHLTAHRGWTRAPHRGHASKHTQTCNAIEGPVMYEISASAAQGMTKPTEQLSAHFPCRVPERLSCLPVLQHRRHRHSAT